MEIELSGAAELDLRHIVIDGLGRFGDQASQRYVARLREAMTLIGGFPRIARVREEIDEETRAFPVGVHLILYRIKDDGNPFVLRIRHGREDWAVD
ncbi:type II toxin-antitoxin system RelE/ParE family toxin [Sphingomonas adhaesiva]|uniref:type II toxin-antitoxin system RelE/ParE family toxin n=1 Tax=Sphingomonas adhaesiva TaxID=28212 RepID=UPI002FFBEEE4